MRYRKGPYFVENGDFSLAGSASMDYLSALDAPFAEMTLGSHNYRRLLTASFGADCGVTMTQQTLRSCRSVFG